MVPRLELFGEFLQGGNLGLFMPPGIGECVSSYYIVATNRRTEVGFSHPQIKNSMKETLPLRID